MSQAVRQKAFPRYETLEDLTAVAKFVVEATGFERQTLWERWAQDSPRPIAAYPSLDWRDCSRGWLVKVGELDGSSRQPVNLWLHA